MPLRIATAPVRRRAELEQAVAGLRAAAMCADAWKSAGARFSPAVLGEALVGMMSAQFRKLLQSPEAKQEMRRGREAKRGIVGPPARTGAGATWTPPDDEHRVPPSFAASRDQQGASGFESRAGANDTSRPGIDGQSVPGTRIETAWETAVANGTSPPVWPEGSPSNGASKLPEPAGTLAEKLREYWSLERRARQAHAASPVESGHASDRRTAESADEARPKPERPRLAGQADFASRLQAFVSGGAKPGGGDLRGDIREMQQPPAHPSFLPNAPAQGPSMPLAGEFADRLAQTLREQALHHGIDLT
jgi:hypothetical protein